MYCPICTGLGKRQLHKEPIAVCKFRRNRRTKGCTFLISVNETACLTLRCDIPVVLQVFHTVHLSSIILRITNRCHFFVIFLYYMSLSYMFRASISPSSGVFPAVATCCHLVHVVLGLCPRASGSFDVGTAVRNM